MNCHSTKTPHVVTAVHRHASLVFAAVALVGCTTEVKQSDFDGAAGLEDTWGVASQTCRDNPNAQCANRALDQCKQNPQYMQENCCATCKSKTPSIQNDKVWEFDPRTWAHADTTGDRRLFFDQYLPTRRLYNSQYGFHVFATSGVRATTISATNELLKGMLGAMNSASLRDQFKGYHIFVLTMNDPSVSGGDGEQLAGATANVTLFRQEMVCRTFEGRYREWNTPVHELGHSIEFKLGLRTRTEELIDANYNGAPGALTVEHRESYAWMVQSWFYQHPLSFDRDTMPKWQWEYMAETFSSANSYRPTCNF